MKFEEHMKRQVEKWRIEDCKDRILAKAVRQQREILRRQLAKRQPKPEARA